MAHTKAQLIRNPDTGELVQRNIRMEASEEAAQDAEEAEWEADRPNRIRENLIEIEMERLRKDENAQLKQKAEDTLRQRGEIT